MGNFLDLRKKEKGEVQIIEKVIVKEPSYKTETLKILSVILIVLALGWGISNADDIPIVKTIVKNISGDEQGKKSSTYGEIIAVDGQNITVQKIEDTKLVSDTYNVDISNAEIQSNEYVPLSSETLVTGLRIIVQGYFNDNNIKSTKIFVFPREGIELITATTTEDIIATSTATTTTDIATTTDATTTDETATTTTTEENTGGIVNEIIDTVGDVIDTVTDTVTDIVDAIVGTSTDDTSDSPNTETPPTEPEPTEPEPEAPPTDTTEPDQSSDTSDSSDTTESTESSEPSPDTSSDSGSSDPAPSNPE